MTSPCQRFVSHRVAQLTSGTERDDDDAVRLPLRRRRFAIGGKGDKNLLGGKGANLAEMAGDRPAGAAGLHHHDRGVRASITTRAATSRESLRDEVADGLAHIEGVTGKTLRRRGRSAARLGPLGRARVDAGDDGHRPQPRPQRRRPSQGLAATSRRRALRLGQLSPLHPDVFRRRARPRSRPRSRKRSRSPRKTSGFYARHRAGGRGLAGAGRASTRRIVEEQLGQALPAGRPRAAVGRDRRGVRLAGSRSAPRSIAGSTTFPATGAPRSTSRRWCSATWARPRPPASPSPAIRRPASAPITASS